MHRNQNRSRSRDNFGNNNRNRQRNNGNRRRDDFDRNSDRFQGGLGRRDGQGGQMSQIDRGSFGMNTAGYSQGMGMYGNPQNQMVGFGGGYGGSGGFQQQNRFGMNPQQMINPWANNMMGGPSSAATGDEAKLAMNILNAVLSSSGPQASGRGMSPPPNKMRRMDFRDGGYDDRRRRARSPPGRSHQNRQQSSQRGSDRRGRDGHSSSQRNDDHRFRNSLSKSPGVSKSSRQSSVDENSEFVFRKRLTFEERERETKKYKDLPLKALKCHMCEKTVFHNVTAYLAHVDSKGHNKVARAYHEKIAASANLIKQTARLALQKEMKKAKAQGIKVVEKECRVCEGPMVYGNLKHKNILACKILHTYHDQTVCCGKDHKTKSLVEEHCLSLAHLQANYESEDHEEERDANEGEKGTTGDELAEDEEESQKRLKRDVARRKRKFGDDETDEEEEEEEEEEKITSDHQEEKQEVDEIKTEEEKDNSEQVNGNDTEEKDNEVEQMESEVKEEENEDEKKESESKEEQMEVDVKKEDSEKADDETNKESNDQEETKVKDEKNNKENDDKKNRPGNQKRDNKAKLKKEKDNKYQGKTLPQLTFLELLEFHKKNSVDDPEKLTGYDPAQPTGLNYIDTRVSYHCMACLEYCPAFPEDLKVHSCSKEHYDLFRNKYMKVKGVRDSPTSLKRLKNLGKKKEENKDEKEEDKDSKKKEDTNVPEDEGDNKSEKIVDEKSGSSDKGTTHENEEVGGDDALYDPYEGESGDLTTMLQEKKDTGKQEAKSTASYEVNDEAHESEAENYEDNILDYEEDVVEDEDKEEKYQGEEKEGNQCENEECDENEEYQGDEDNEGDNENTNEEVEVNENEEECENDEVEGNEDEEEYENENENENENEEFEDNEGYAEQVEDEEEQQEEEEDEEEQEEDEDEDVEEVPQPPARRGRSRRAF